MDVNGYRNAPFFAVKIGTLVDRMVSIGDNFDHLVLLMNNSASMTAKLITFISSHNYYF